MERDEYPGFLALSARLTGRDEGELRATGLVGRHHATTLARVGRAAVGRFLDDLAAAGGDPGRVSAPESREIARAITHLWRTGGWPEPG
ncbi:hypothetical protein I5Q34_24330 [Streptomyces sp. AV19]|uniref:hypothetical protein n=1 Tax=Streptomyces sp. AV19 TaxID=2793068 RepID=UPI0018FE262E|nr:hypothetical protein [Streptomyces sp. AV19]MBH1937357.1 hypothetical protein [Streptomyces sp. AV19]MDG4533913.1 hypothetical protein [Streptomyces sp. AV19]